MFSTLKKIHREPVVIKRPEEIQFCRNGNLRKTYYLPHIDTTVSTEHHYMYYWAKREQLMGERLARKNVVVINVDMHDDFGDSERLSPDLTGKTQQAALDDFWKYSCRIHCGSHIMPLVHDGTVSKLVWLAYNRIGEGKTLSDIAKSHDLRYFDRYKFEMLMPFPGAEGFIRMHELEPDPKKLQEGELAFYTLGFDLFPAMARDILGAGVNDGAHLILSIDSDRFVSQDEVEEDREPIKGGTGLNYVNERSLEGFQRSLRAIRQIVGRPKTFICTSTSVPMFADPEAVKVILPRLIGMLEEN